jgi:putative flippase GtrA
MKTQRLLHFYHFMLRKRFNLPAAALGFKLRLLLAGVLNTVFGYCSGIYVYTKLLPFCHLFTIGLVSNWVSISFSFMVYKYYVYQSTGSFWREYIRSFAVYGFGGALSTLLMWAMLDYFSLDIWLAQMLVLPIVFLFSVVGHGRFTFKHR